MVEVKGWRNGLLVTLPDTLELDELLAAIRERLEQGRNLELWKGSVATIDFGARIVLPDALDSIIGVLKDGYGILPTAVVSEIPETRAAADRLTLTLYDVLPMVVMPPVGQTPEPEKAPQIGQGNAHAAGRKRDHQGKCCGQLGLDRQSHALLLTRAAGRSGPEGPTFEPARWMEAVSWRAG